MRNILYFIKLYYLNHSIKDYDWEDDLFFIICTSTSCNSFGSLSQTSLSLVLHHSHNVIVSEAMLMFMSYVIALVPFKR